MSDLNAMTRIVNGQRVPAIVVHKETGERLQRAPIDCRELIATGEWEWLSDFESKAVAPSAEPTKVAVAEAEVAPVEEADADEPAKAESKAKASKGKGK
jgi:hypothetical protein